MSSFYYKALQKDGSVIEGGAEGGSRGLVLRQLQEKGMQVISLDERSGEARNPESEGRKESGEKRRTAALRENRLSSKQLIQFTEELSDLIRAGVQLDAALGSIAKRSDSRVIAGVAALCHEKVRDGSSLASALRGSSPSFNDLYCNLVAAGEASGALGDILSRQVRYLTTLAELRGKLALALIYPLFLVVSGAVVSAIFVFFLIPKLRRLVESTGGDLPPVAGLLLGAGDFFRDHWIWLVAFGAVVLVTLLVLGRRESVKRWRDEKILRAPLFGRLLLTRFNVQFVETLSNLLTNGLPLVKALELVRGTTANRYVRERIADVTDKVSEGATLHRCMEKAGTFESGLIDMVRIGEDTGQLASSMSKAGERLDREFSRSIERVGSVVQPAIVLIMALLVGTMAYMMISVIYETISILRDR